MTSEHASPIGGLPNTVDDVPPDPDTMFPDASPGDLDQKEDASVGIEDPRKEVATPEGISAPFADDGAVIPTAPVSDGTPP
jgi:hypothetical protein